MNKNNSERDVCSTHPTSFDDDDVYCFFCFLFLFLTLIELP